MRREQRRRSVRRRRAIGAVVFGAVAVVVLVLLVLLLGGSSGAARHAAGPALPAHPRPVTGARTGAAGAHSPATPARPAAGGRPGSTPVPILMYHVIASPPAGAPFPGLYVTPGEFSAQMEALERAGWHAVTLEQVEAHWRRGVPLPAGKPIVITFDNGYRSQYTEALPVLKRLGWPGVENIQLTGLPPSQGGLSPAEVRALIAAGWELDTQGLSHADLVTLGARALHYQVAVARRTLQRLYRVPVNWFCYPSGHYDATVIAAVRDAGYEGSTTVVPGWAHRGEDPYRLHRLRVLGGTTSSALLALISAIRADPPAPPSYGEA